jgi:hypothetical protein
MSSRIFNLLPKLCEFAEKSTICHRHGAVLLKNGTPITWSYNNIKGNNTLHAEHNVISQFLRIKGVEVSSYFEKRKAIKTRCVLWN